jgi:AraC-like DNA-binding protein
MLNSLIYEGQNFFENNVPVYLNIAHVMNEHDCQIHSHDFIEIAYINAGSGVHLVGNTKYPVSKGDLSIINTNVPHAYICNGDAAELMVFNCIFIPEFIDCSLLNSSDFKDVATSILFNSFFIEDSPIINLKLQGAQQMEIEELYGKMQQEFFSKPKGYINVIRSLLVEMLTKIFRYLEAENNQSGKIIERRAEIVHEAISFLKNNYASSNLNINEVAMHTFLSPSYLSKLFKEDTGRSFSEYLQNIRISAACDLLKTTDKKIIDIMMDVGLKDIKHFNRLFKKVTGMTPREYRKGGDHK